MDFSVEIQEPVEITDITKPYADTELRIYELPEEKDYYVSDETDSYLGKITIFDNCFQVISEKNLSAAVAVCMGLSACGGSELAVEWLWDSQELRFVCQSEETTLHLMNEAGMIYLLDAQAAY